jgi:hypothetical protein
MTVGMNKNNWIWKGLTTDGLWNGICRSIPKEGRGERKKAIKIGGKGSKGGEKKNCSLLYSGVENKLRFLAGL